MQMGTPMWRVTSIAPLDVAQSLQRACSCGAFTPSPRSCRRLRNLHIQIQKTGDANRPRVAQVAGLRDEVQVLQGDDPESLDVVVEGTGAHTPGNFQLRDLLEKDQALAARPMPAKTSTLPGTEG